MQTETHALHIAYVLMIGTMAGFGLLPSATFHNVPQRRTMRAVIENPDRRNQRKQQHGYTKAVLLKQTGSLWRSDPSLSSSHSLATEGTKSFVNESYIGNSVDEENGCRNRHHLEKVSRRLALSATQSLPASRFFQAVELGSPTTLKHEEWHHRSTLIFFKTETAGRCQTAQGVFNEILRSSICITRIKTPKKGTLPWGCPFSAMLRCALVEVWSYWAPGPSSAAATLFRVVNTTVDFPAQASYAVIDPSHSTASPVDDIWIAGWALRVVSSMLIYAVLVYCTLLMALDFLDCKERLVLLGNTVSPELSLRDKLPFLNLQIWENVIAFVTLRSYIEGVFHRETFSVISCGISFITVVVI